MLALGRRRESLDKARKAAPKADYIPYAIAAIDAYGEADSRD